MKSLTQKEIKRNREIVTNIVKNHRNDPKELVIRSIKYNEFYLRGWNGSLPRMNKPLTVGDYVIAFEMHGSFHKHLYSIFDLSP